MTRILVKHNDKSNTQTSVFDETFYPNLTYENSDGWFRIRYVKDGKGYTKIWYRPHLINVEIEFNPK